MDDSQNAERLIIAIVENAHAGSVQGALVDKKFRVTRINTAGGFLRKGNVTLLIGVTTDQVDDAIEIIRLQSPKTEGEDPGVSTMLFVLPVSRFARI